MLATMPLISSDTLRALGRFCIALPVVIAACLLCSNAYAFESPVVKIDSGVLEGLTKDGVDEYLGIPYAAPPIGTLRWKPPQPVKSWKAMLVAAQFANTCAQNSELGAFAKRSNSEDCLYLNVYTAHSDPHAEKRPVLVWIHGGGYAVGESNDYDGSKLVTAGGAVVVTINYRLGILGFLAHPSLDKEGHSFGNYGLMDQQFALRWVKRNIGKFGGDPENVTIFGESSGGTSVMSQLISPSAAGLFQYAISQSGAAIVLIHPAMGAPRPIGAAEETGMKFAQAAGCADQSLECLRKLTVERILAVQRPYMVNQAIIDGQVLPMPYAEAFRSGHFNHVPLVNGSNHDEWRWSVGSREIETGKPMTLAEYSSSIEATYGKQLSASVMDVYSPKTYLTPSLAFGAAVTDSLFACTGRKLNEWVADQTPTYAFEFADQTAPSYLNPTSIDLGAAHTFEIQYLFPLYHGGAGTSHELNPLQKNLSDKMVEYWTSVGKAAEGKLWAKYDPKQDNYLSLVLPEPTMTSGSFSADHKCEFWDHSGLY